MLKQLNLGTDRTVVCRKQCQKHYLYIQEYTQIYATQTHLRTQAQEKNFFGQLFAAWDTLKKENKTSFILVVIHVDFFGLLKYYDKEPLHYKSPCGNHYVERSRFLCQRYIKSNWCNKLGELLRNLHYNDLLEICNWYDGCPFTFMKIDLYSKC